MLTAPGLYNEMANRTSSQSMPNNPRVKKYLLQRPNEELCVTSYHSASSKNPCWAGIVRKSKLNIRNDREGCREQGRIRPQCIYISNSVRNGHTHPSNNVLRLEKSLEKDKTDQEARKSPSTASGLYLFSLEKRLLEVYEVTRKMRMELLFSISCTIRCTGCPARLRE